VRIEAILATITKRIEPG